jgi:hypothetical protein
MKILAILLTLFILDGCEHAPIDTAIVNPDRRSGIQINERADKAIYKSRDGLVELTVGKRDQINFNYITLEFKNNRSENLLIDLSQIQQLPKPSFSTQTSWTIDECEKSIFTIFSDCRSNKHSIPPAQQLKAWRSFSGKDLVQFRVPFESAQAGKDEVLISVSFANH